MVDGGLLRCCDSFAIEKGDDGWPFYLYHQRVRRDLYGSKAHRALGIIAGPGLSQGKPLKARRDGLQSLDTLER
jgi:hypothetical protein